MGTLQVGWTPPRGNRHNPGNHYSSLPVTSSAKIICRAGCARDRKRRKAPDGRQRRNHRFSHLHNKSPLVQDGPRLPLAGKARHLNLNRPCASLPWGFLAWGFLAWGRMALHRGINRTDGRLRRQRKPLSQSMINDMGLLLPLPDIPDIPALDTQMERRRRNRALCHIRRARISSRRRRRSQGARSLVISLLARFPQLSRLECMARFRKARE
jgi:hypothetical protein